MAGRSPSEAFHNFIAPMNRALTCVSAGGRLSISREHAQSSFHTNVDYAATLTAGDAVRLRGTSTPLWLGIRHAFLIVEGAGDRGPYKTTTVGYSYRFHADIGHDRSEILAFQWNRDASPPLRKYPHLHIGSAISRGSSFRQDDFSDLHIPTGRLSLEAVLLFAIQELGVEPAENRSHRSVLDVLIEGDRIFREWSTQAGDWY